MKEVVCNKLSRKCQQETYGLESELLLINGVFRFALLEISQCLGQMIV